MKDAFTLFKEVYDQHHDVEKGIAELKRKGFGQMDTVKVLMQALSIDIVRADELVRDSLAWTT